MTKTCPASKQTCYNWLLDAVLAASGLAAILSGVYFLFLPVGGYQGGRNPLYGVTILFERHTWSVLHTWTGVAMIVAVGLHLAIHWRWLVSMARRIAREVTGKGPALSRGGRLNLTLNLATGVSFAITAVSGVYFLFAPSVPGSRLAGAGFLFSRATWDLLHTWGGVAFVAALVLHLYIHWGWIAKTTPRVVRSLPMGQIRQRGFEPAQVPVEANN